MTDSLTILECIEGKRCAKLYRDVAQKPEPYDAGFMFTPHRVEVANLAELAEQLEGLRSQPRCMVIRDALRADAQLSPLGLVARRRVDRPGDPAPFEHAPHHHAMFDADATAAPFDPADPIGSVQRWRAQLPPPLRNARGLFQFSASQHLSATVRGHLWVWLAEPLGNVPLARWSIRNGLDPAVFHAVQPLYVADPLFAEGLADPLDRALVHLPGAELCTLDLLESDFEDRGALDNKGQRLSSVALEEVGEPSLEPAAVEARAMIAKQLARAFEGPGKRWDLCGHVGGACANAGLPPEECCAILESLRAGDVPDHEFANGLRWALGAYSFSARPLGLKGMRELLGPITADKIGAAVGALGKVYEPPPEPVLDEQGHDWGGLPFEAFDLSKPLEPINHVCKALDIAPGKPTAILSFAGTSKTPMSLDLAVAVGVEGQRFHGHLIDRHGKVLCVVTEGARNARRKLERICQARGVRVSECNVAPVQAPPGFLNVETAEALGNRAVADGYRMVVIDTYNSAFDGAADRNTNAFSLALKVLGDISDRFDITFVVLLHTRKEDKNKRRAPTLQDIDGHNSIAGAVQCALGLWRPEENNKHRIEVVCVRALDAGFESYSVEWADTPASSGEIENGLRCSVVDPTADVEHDDSPAYIEAETVRMLLQAIDTSGGSTTMYHLQRNISTGLGREAKAGLVMRLQREGLIVVNALGASQQITRAGRSQASANAGMKRTGFLGTKKKVPKPG